MPQLKATHLLSLLDAYRHQDHQRAIALIRNYQGNGTPLPAAIVLQMSWQLGYDLQHVRLHTDSNAQRAASALSANAFTIGDDIFFATERIQPLLLAHELVHVAQQSWRNEGAPATENDLEIEAANLPAEGVQFRCPSELILREPTFPRRCTRDALVLETERILALNRDAGAGDETTRMWSRVSSNFDSSSIGSVARRVWTFMFLRHFVDPDFKPGVESVFPRYFFSRKYGWIDGQHFFGFIDYAEVQDQALGNEATAFNAATKQGVQIEKDQQKVRDKVILGAPRDPKPAGLMQVQPPNTGLFRLPQMIVGGLAGVGASIYGDITLDGTQKELFSQLDERRRQKFFLDSAKSAFSYEDIPSNQLGIVFYFRYKNVLRSLPPYAIDVAFVSLLDKFLKDNNVENDPATVDKQAAASGLPMKERYLAPKATEEDIRKRYPDLFIVPAHAA